MYKTITVLVLALFAYTEGKRSCSEILTDVEQMIDALTEEMGEPPVGVHKPQCLPDGTFAPKQCRGSIQMASDGVPCMPDHNYVYVPRTERKPDETKSKSLKNCCVPRCHTRGYITIEGHGKVSYHTFPPVNDPLRKQWLINIRRDEDDTFKVNKHTVVCSLHFTSEHLETHGFSGKRTKLPGCVPTVFECWKDLKHIYKKTKERPSNRLQQTRCNATESVDENSVSNDTCTNDNQVISDDVTEVGTNEISVSVNESDVENMLLKHEIERLQAKMKKLESDNVKFKQENATISAQLDKCLFSVENISDKDFSFYTGFASRKVFEAVLNFLDPGPNGENIKMNCGDYVDDSNDGMKRGRPRKLSPANQFFLFLCRVKVGMFEQDLANRFSISVSTVSNIIITWANFMYLRLGGLNIWPTKETVLKHMPETFKEKYPSTRVIIDCSELKVEMASSLLLKSQTYSNYKSTNTLKGLIGIAPSGSVSFVSQLYTGCISDKEITTRSGFLDLPFEKGDSVMADKGFDIQDLLDDKGVKLNIPPFLGLSGQMIGDDVLRTQSIASERIHVERAINKIKTFHIFDQVIPLSLAGSINQIWTVCALLTLFQDPIISTSKSDK